MKKYIEKNFKKTEIGNIPQDWELKEIGEIINFNFGERITKQKAGGSKYPVYGGGGKSFKTDNYNRENEFIISRFAMSKNCVRKVVGKFWLIDSGGSFSVKKEKDNIIIKNYFAYFLFSNQEKIYSLGRGTAQRNLDVKHLKKLKIPIPPLNEQKNIAKILGDFDAKIELNNRENEILEEMGKAIFKHWFVDFQYENYKKQGGKMMWNENLKKEIPEKWEVGKLENYFFETKEKNKENLPQYTIGKRGIKIIKKTNYKTNNHKVFEKYDFITGIGIDEMNFNMEIEKGVCSPIYNVFKLKNKDLKYFMYFYVKFNIKIYRDRFTKSLTRRKYEIVKKDFLKCPFYIAPQNILEVFNQKTKLFFEKILENKKENEILRNLRDTLLPKLIKGEIRLK